ncbi:hypothetical protein L596_025764 [Steinernema carpocapsae]|uniref:Uncharacterized protein n=1 Tax=Steinernema carpocapsae TaxID=34508 RepID=A0A4U5M8S1_STECR|nr:hypothetical protein L596_025764 [Steinernema carpocapsae]
MTIAHESQTESDQEKTLNTKKIKNKPDFTAAAFKELQEENRALKKEILRLKSGGACATDAAVDVRILELKEMCQRSFSENALLFSKLVKIEHHGEDHESMEMKKDMDSEDRQQNMEECARNVHKINVDMDRLRKMIEERKKEFEDASHLNAKDSARFLEIHEEIRMIGKLTEEKDSLMRMLKEVTNSGKVSNQYRQRLEELEEEQAALKQKVREYARYESQKKESDKQLAKARLELENAKKMRVDMVKKLHSESTKCMQMKNALDRATVQILFELTEKARIDAIQKNQKLLEAKEELKEARETLRAVQRRLCERCSGSTC